MMKRSETIIISRAFMTNCPWETRLSNLGFNTNKLTILIFFFSLRSTSFVSRRGISQKSEFHIS
jgi:hypothetical protein